MTSQTYIALLLCLLLAQPAPVHGGQAQPAPQADQSRTNAAGLVQKADRAISYVVKLARDSKDKALNQTTDDAKPFWNAVKKLNTAIGKVDRGLYLKDKTFFSALAETTAAVEEVKITFRMSRAKDEAVVIGIEKVDAAVSLLRENYSKEAARLKKGGQLTAQERQQLAEMKNKQAELQRKLTELEGKVGRNQTLIEGLRDVRRRSTEVQNCHDDLRGFLFATTAINVISGLIWGWHWWWGPFGGWGPGFAMGFSAVYVDVINVVNIDYDWDLAENYIELEHAYDLEVELEQAELEAMDEYLDEADFDIPTDALMDIAEDELEFEGEMDLLDPDTFDDFDTGDFDLGMDEGEIDLDVGEMDMDFDDFDFDLDF